MVMVMMMGMGDDDDADDDDDDAQAEREQVLSKADTRTREGDEAFSRPHLWGKQKGGSTGADAFGGLCLRDSTFLARTCFSKPESVP